MAILVAGGTKGIGLAIAKAFAADAGDVILAYHSDEDAARRCGEGGRASWRASASHQGRRRNAGRLRRDGRGGARSGRSARPSRSLRGRRLRLERARGRSRSLRPRGHYQRHKPAVPGAGGPAASSSRQHVFYLTSRGGRIVVPNYAAVGVAKALAESLMRYLAVELAPQRRADQRHCARDCRDRRRADAVRRRSERPRASAPPATIRPAAASRTRTTRASCAGSLRPRRNSFRGK